MRSAVEGARGPGATQVILREQRTGDGLELDLDVQRILPMKNIRRAGVAAPYSPVPLW